MPLRYLDDSNYTLGMIRDTPSWLLPNGAVYDSLNMIYDQPGIARQRNGSLLLNTGTQTAFCTSLGFCYSADGTAIEELYGVDGKTGTIYNVSKTTGASTSVGVALTAASIIGRPVRHFGFLEFPSVVIATGVRRCAVVAGQTTISNFTNAVVAQVTAGNQQVTLTGADVTTNIKVGALVNILTATRQHTARVVSIDTTKLFTIWPAPTFTDAAVPIGGVLTGAMGASNGGTCVASFQNRLLHGNTNDFASVGATLVSDRRVYYSPLPTESLTSAGGLTVTGSTWNNSSVWPTLNYFDIPGADPIVAMEPVNDNQLLILTSTHPVLFSGNLTTQLATTSPTITFDISEVPGNATCISDLGVQRTPKSVVWAGYGGIYAWNGREPIDLTQKKINTYWRALVRGSSFALHGSAYVRGHYILSGTSGGTTFVLALNLDTLAWTRFSNIDIFLGTPRPTDPSQVFAAHWWDQTGAAPTMTNRQVFRMESMFDPFVLPQGVGAVVANQDDNGTNVDFSVTTRTIGGDVETQKIQQRCTIRYQANMSGANGTVTAQSKVDSRDIASDSVRAIGFLSNTDTRVITNATNANPIVITTSQQHGLQTEDYVDINGVLGNLNANGRWRIVKTSGTAFSLIGGIGSAAYTSGGSCKKITESDFITNTLDVGQGVSFIVSGASIGGFEFHGIRVAFLEKEPVMSA